MKEQIVEAISSSINKLIESEQIPNIEGVEVTIERTRDKKFGDFASNIAMRLTKKAGKPPRDLAEMIIANLPELDLIEKAEIAGPGFINIYITDTAITEIVSKVLESGDDYGKSKIGNGKKVQVEFVSANPTGPLHVGHGRGAAYGAAVADLLEHVGFTVDREYYVNDAGRQMDILATSIWLRYLEQNGKEIRFPENGYKGQYIFDIAKLVNEKYGDIYCADVDAVFADVILDESQGGDKEKHIDDLISNSKKILGQDDYRKVFDVGLEFILSDIKDDLEGFGIEYQNWFSERSLFDNNLIEEKISALQEKGFIYEKEGVLWFKSSEFGDEKDRPVRRSNGDFTYFASDIAYHINKYERDYDQIIDVWGSDHHGYVPRVKAAMKASGKEPDVLNVLLVQFAILYRNGEKAPMSTRSGEFVTLRELREEVGRDAARFFYVMRKAEQHLDFDLDLAKSQSSDNPVYYIQYAHARVCRIFNKKLPEKGMTHNVQNGFDNISMLEEEHENKIMTTLAKYPEVVEGAALRYEPHTVCHYLRTLANDFHAYYNVKDLFILSEDANLRDARLNLILAVKQVLANGLKLLCVSAPEEM